MGHIGPSLIPLVYGPKIPGFNFKDLKPYCEKVRLAIE